MNPINEDKQAKRYLEDLLLEHVAPELKALGFKPTRRAGTGFPRRYARDVGNRIDLLDFQWDKYRRPYFIINFRSVEDPDDLEKARRDPKHAWAWNGSFRAGPSAWSPRWFGQMGILTSVLRLPWRLETEMTTIKRRLREIDAFLKGGRPSRNLGDIGMRQSDIDRELLLPPTRMISAER